MHRNQRFCVEFGESTDCFFRIHVHFARQRRIVRTNWKQRDLDLVTLTNFLETGKVRTVATMKNRASVRGDNKPAETTMPIRQKTGAPMMTRRQGNFERAELDRLPFIKL